MEKSNIDAIIQNRLSGHQTYINTESLWNAIEEEISIDNPPVSLSNRKKIHRRVLTALFVSFGILALMYISMSNEMTPTEDTTQPSKTLSTASIPSDNANIQSLQQHYNQSSTISEQYISDKKETKRILNITTPETTYRILQSQSTQTVRDLSPISQSITSSTDLSERILKKTTISEMPPRLKSIDRSPIIHDILKQSISPAPLQEAVRPRFQTIRLLGNTNVPINTISQFHQIDQSNLLPLKDKVNCYRYSQGKTNLSILGYYGPGLSIRTLEAIGPEMDDHVEERNTSEVILENHRTGLQIKANHHNGLYLKVGIESSIINEKYQQFSIDTTKEIRQIVIEVIEYPDGSIEEIYGDQLITIISSKEWKKYNDFKTIDLSAFVGYEGKLRKWKYLAEIGVLYNIQSRFNGTSVDEITLNPTSDTSYRYKTQTGIDLHLSCGIGYPIGNQSTIWAMPSLRSDLMTISNIEYKVNQSYQMANLLIGLEHQF